MVNQYRRGADFERTVRDDLQGHGYEVIRSAGSKSKIDLVAIKPGELLLIQCKTTQRFDGADWNALLGIAERCGAWPILASKVPGKSAPEYRHLCAYAKTGARRYTGIHWNPWHPDPFAASDGRGEE